jgi:hypothetical protein
MALDVHRQSVRRLVAARAVLLQAFHHNPVEISGVWRVACNAVAGCRQIESAQGRSADNKFERPARGSFSDFIPGRRVIPG